VLSASEARALMVSGMASSPAHICVTETWHRAKPAATGRMGGSPEPDFQQDCRVPTRRRRCKITRRGFHRVCRQQPVWLLRRPVRSLFVASAAIRPECTTASTERQTSTDAREADGARRRVTCTADPACISACREGAPHAEPAAVAAPHGAAASRASPQAAAQWASAAGAARERLAGAACGRRAAACAPPSTGPGGVSTG